MITFQSESWEIYYPDCLDLWKEDYQEIAEDKERRPFNPDMKGLKANARAGCLNIITARDDLYLIGYRLDIIMPHPHHMDVICAFQSALYVKREYRKLGVGIKLLKEAEKVLKTKGVQEIYSSTPAIKDSGKVYLRLGYKHCDTIYKKFIG